MKKIGLFFSVLLMLVSSAAFAQNIKVTGRITDAQTGEPIPYAAIVEKGTMNGVVSDEDGVYNIEIASANKNETILVYSSIGHKSVEEVIGTRTVVNVTLKHDAELLDETIVVAFGTSTKETFTGSATVIKSGDIAKVQSSNPTRALEGMVAGVQMTTSSGAPGSNPSIRIRGIGSIDATAAPLYVVDGVPYSGDINNINSADIESITVQKDAASNSLYGARGANGVIMITTKKAKAGNAVVNVDAKWGWNSRALQTYDVFTDPGEYYEAYAMTLRNYYHKMAGTTDGAYAFVNQNIEGLLGYQVFTLPKENPFLIGEDGKLNPQAQLGRVITDDATKQSYYLTPDNWLDEAYRNSLRQEYNVSVSGTTGKASLFASFGYLNSKGIAVGSDMERYTARLRADYQAKKWLKIGMNAGYAHYSWNNANQDEGKIESTGNMFGVASVVAPIYPLYVRDAQGNIMKDKYGWDRYDYGVYDAGAYRPYMANANPIQAAILNKNNSTGNALSGLAYAKVDFLRHFSVTFNAGMNLDEFRGTNVLNKYYGQFATDGGIVTKSHGRTLAVNLQEIINYDQTFNNKHHISVMLGHEWLKETTEKLEASKSSMFSGDNDELSGAVVDGQNSLSSRSKYNVEGYFARAQYDFAEKLFFNASYRLDASSNFHPDHRWGSFWAAGAAWLINKEPWVNASWIDMLKIKASVGQQGNDGIGAFRYVNTYELRNYNDKPATSFLDKGNKSVTWETNTNYNVGADFSFWSGRLSGSVEYFYRKTSDMLYFFALPNSIGYGGYYDNIGNMRNSGVEIDLQTNIIRTENFNWNFYLNLTHYTNKVLSIPEKNRTTEVEGHKGFASGSYFVGEGLPLNTFYIKSFAGVDPETGNSLWWKDVKDEKGNITGKEKTSTYAQASYYLSGNPTPKIYGGFGTSFDFYGFDISVAFTYSVGGVAYDSGYANFMSSPLQNSSGKNMHKDVLKAWTPENTESQIPAIRLDDRYTAGMSDRFLTDASYLNFQNAQVGYTLPSRITQKFGVSKLRIYATCDNICYVSARKGFDPRYSFTGDTNSYVNLPVRTLSGGINITF